MIIQHNMAAVNAMRQLGLTQTNLQKSAERLSSGYRINRAADNAAELAISEKKRSQIRGLLRAVKNAQEGMDFIQTGDGAMNEIANMLQRMRELSVQALNDVNTDEDRAKLQMEMDELQSEIDRTNDQTEFNNIPVFEHYAETYFVFEGGRHWSQDQEHIIDDTNNTLNVKYQLSEDEPEKEFVLTVENGKYTTQELMDEIDDIIMDMGEEADGLCIEYTDEGNCNMVLTDGELINGLDGGLSYLFFDEFVGTQVGTVIGTTIFLPDSSIWINDRNNELKFKIENFDGTTKDMDITIPEGMYSRQEMIDYLNGQLAGTGIEASEYGENCIQMGGENGIITGLRGNMFEIDEPEDGIMTSVFYDNTKYGSVIKTSAEFVGGAVLPNNPSDAQNNRYHIDDTNNKLLMRVNGRDTDPFVEITLDKGDYFASEMAQQLCDKMAAAGIDAKADSYTKTIRTGNNNTISFSGLKITSGVEGRESTIEFDRDASTAFEDLFCKGRYVDAGNMVSTTSGYYQYTAPKVTSGKLFASSDFPMTIDAYNKSFQFAISEKPLGGTTISTANYTVTLTEKEYNSLDEIVAEFNEQFNGAGAAVGLKGKLQAVNDGNKLVIKPTDDNRTVTNRILLMGTANPPYAGGYDLLFVGKKVEESTQPIIASGRQPEVILPVFTFPMEINSSNNTIDASVAGVKRPVVIPDGTYEKDELLEEINKQLKGETTATPNNFYGSGSGNTVDKNRSDSGEGHTYTQRVNVSGEGDGNQQGIVGGTGNKPAECTIPINLPAKTTVTPQNNQFTITVNKKEYSVYLDSKDYTPSELASALQSKLDAGITSPSDKVKVSLTNNRLHFATDRAGLGYTVAVTSDNSSFVEDLATTKTSASASVNTPMKSSFTVDGNSNTFVVTVDGVRRQVTVPNGNYTPGSFATALNQQFQNEGINASASVSGNYLSLTNTVPGQGTSIAYDTRDGGTSVNAAYGELVTETPATASLNRPLQDNIHMEDGSNQFTVRLSDGGAARDVTVTIPPGDYTRQELADKLDTLFGNEIKVDISPSGYLSFTTAAEGDGVSIAVSNNISGSAGTAMFGETMVTTPDVTASIDEDGHMVLTGSDNGKSYQLAVGPGSMIPPTYVTKTIQPSYVNGNVTTRYFTIQSQAGLDNPTEIVDYNKEFNFRYISPNGTQNVSVSLDEKSYTPQELAAALQTKLEDVLGPAFVVSAESSGLKIKATDYGNNYAMQNMSGGFYDYIIKGTKLREVKEEPINTDGKQIVSDTYIIGRKDVKNEICKIKPGIDDHLSVDVTINDKVHTLEMTLDPGEYDADALIQELQEKLDDAVKEAGLPEHCVLAGVGLFDSNVAGANDANALDIYLNPDVELEEGEYRIEGLSGNALFEIFYKTEGELEPAYTTGSKDITGGVEILPGENELKVDVDGVTYTYEIPEGQYTQEEILDKLNELFSAPDATGKTAQIKASVSGDAIQISHKNIGAHKVNNVQGSARDDLFYEMHGRKDYDSGLMLQVGANAGQLIRLERFSMSTLSLGINSITLSQHKYAQKALARVDKALGYLSQKRSIYGASQNRLEYTIRGNEIMAENMQDSESRDRDLDMADELVQQAKHQILQKTATAVLSQSMQQNRSVLDLLGK